MDNKIFFYSNLQERCYEESKSDLRKKIAISKVLARFGLEHP